MEYSETVPIQYQEGIARFMDMDIIVDPRVLIPRPETELLVEITAKMFRERSFKDPLVLDLCTGSGVVSFGLIKLIDSAKIIAADISEDALAVAEKNIEKFDLSKKIELVRSDMFSAFYGREEELKFDCIISNPPYVSRVDYERVDPWVKAEPVISLLGGDEGLDLLNIISREGLKFLRPGGFVAVEVGYDQSEKVKSGLAENGFVDIKSFIDLNGYERVIVGCKNG